MNNKRGTAGTQNWPMELGLIYLFFIFIVSLVAIFFAYSISGQASAKTRISEDVELLNLAQRFLESPECFMADHESGSSLIMETAKFNENRLNDCYKIGNPNYLAFRLRLKSTSQSPYEKEISTINWNGNRPFEKRIAPRPVLFLLEGKIMNGEFTIEVQNLQK